MHRQHVVVDVAAAVVAVVVADVVDTEPFDQELVVFGDAIASDVCHFVLVHCQSVRRVVAVVVVAVAAWSFGAVVVPVER